MGIIQDIYFCGRLPRTRPQIATIHEELIFVEGIITVPLSTIQVLLLWPLSGHLPAVIVCLFRSSISTVHLRHSIAARVSPRGHSISAFELITENVNNDRGLYIKRVAYECTYTKGTPKCRLWVISGKNANPILPPSLVIIKRIISYLRLWSTGDVVLSTEPTTVITWLPAIGALEGTLQMQRATNNNRQSGLLNC